MIKDGRVVRENPTKSFFLLKKSSEPEIGFTTGTCAASSSVAAAKMLFTREVVPYTILTTPKGIKVCIEIENQEIQEDFASCSVQKFSGSDPDVTNGIKIFSKVTKIKVDWKNENGEPKIEIEGGEGVGRVTLPGLQQKIGEAAINPVPRKMILEGVRSEIEKFEKISGKKINFGLKVEISIPEGREIAKKTFNPKLGIVGGISVLGTSGIVEPMSEQAILDTIRLEINVRKAQKTEVLTLVPGNYGSDFLQKEFGFSPEKAVHTSNFVYDSLKMAVEAGFKKIFFCGHLGKLVKVAGGVKNTHSKYGDRRMEIISDVAGLFVPKTKSQDVKKRLSECISTEQAVNILDSLDESHETRKKIMSEIARRIQNQMKNWISEWTDEKIGIEVLIFTLEHGVLGETEDAFTLPKREGR